MLKLPCIYCLIVCMTIPFNNSTCEFISLNSFDRVAFVYFVKTRWESVLCCLCCLSLKILYIRLARDKITKNLEYIKNKVVTSFWCSQFSVYILCFSIFYSFLQSLCVKWSTMIMIILINGYFQRLIIIINFRLYATT